MVETGWSLDELPAVQEARELAGFAEREAERLEQALREEQRERAIERADAAETQAWMARLRGEDLPDVGAMLARSREDTRFPGDQDRQRRQQAREILAQHGLEDVLGGWSGVVLDANMGVLEAPGRGEAQRSAADIEDAELTRYVERNAEDRAYIERFRRSRLPFAQRSAAARSESCQHCTDQGVDDETSYLLHSDPELRVPVTPPGQAETDRQQADRKTAEVDRLMDLGYSWETAQLAATPYGEAVR